MLANTQYTEEILNGKLHFYAVLALRLLHFS